MNRTLSTALLVGAILIVGPLAFAQEVVTAVPVAVDTKPFGIPPALWDAYIGPLIDAAITAIVGYVLYRARGFINLSDEASVRKALHDAAFNAAKAMLQKHGVNPDMMTPIPPIVISDAIDYVREKNPDTAKRAGVDDKGLAEIILSKVPDIISMLTPAAVASPVIIEAKPVSATKPRAVAIAVDKPLRDRLIANPPSKRRPSR